MDPEFKTLLTRTVIVGGGMVAISTAILLVAFRAFTKPFRANVLTVLLIAFILLCCLVLLRLSLIK